MASLVPAHGGLAEPLDLTVPAAEEAAFKAELATLPKVPVSDADLSTVYRFGDGALSPLTGPMDGATYAQCSTRPTSSTRASATPGRSRSRSR
jgi:sulfate adenylyltransferase